ncbi:hypothetical protein [Deinococcus sp.]|uniref:hypothetical protein n=1 Tax=Deinococcus sp. TaxID=47478 RepID=UPI0025DB3E47|nr:hypothetical protein [Deinococcus sp.]
MTYLQRNWTGVLLLAAFGWIHYIAVPDKIQETAYLGWLYILLVAGCAAAGAWLLSAQERSGYALGLLIAAGSIVFFVLTRTVGLPHATGDIGNWGEPAGIAALLTEAAFAALAITRLRRPVLAVSESVANPVNRSR